MIFTFPVSCGIMYLVKIWIFFGNSVIFPIFSIAFLISINVKEGK